MNKYHSFYKWLLKGMSLKWILNHYHINKILMKEINIKDDLLWKVKDSVVTQEFLVVFLKLETSDTIVSAY